MARSRRLPALLALLTVACDSPFLPREESRPALLHVNVQFLDRASVAGYSYAPSAEGGPGARVMASLDPGANDNGRRRAVANDTLRVLGLTITPGTLATVVTVGTPSGGGGSTTSPGYTVPTYLGFVPVAPADFASRPVVVEQAPRIAGLGVAALSTVPLYAVGKAGPDTLTLPRGSDLRLPLVLPPALGVGEIGYWSVWVAGDSGAVLSQGGPGLPPATVRLPAEALPPPASGRLIARLATGRNRQPSYPYGAPSDDRYLVVVAVETRLEWVVQVTAP